LQFHAGGRRQGVRVRQFLLPNVLRLKIPTDDPEVLWTDYINWRIPVDDFAHLTFGIMYTDVGGDMKQRFLERRAKLRALPIPPVEELAERILRGETTIEEVEQSLPPHDRYWDVYLEDHVTQVGQGAIVDRSFENLGIADVGVQFAARIVGRAARPPGQEGTSTGLDTAAAGQDRERRHRRCSGARRAERNKPQTITSPKAVTSRSNFAR
jgi:hypothetical protein